MVGWVGLGWLPFIFKQPFLLLIILDIRRQFACTSTNLIRSTCFSFYNHVRLGQVMHNSTNPIEL